MLCARALSYSLQCSSMLVSRVGSGDAVVSVRVNVGMEAGVANTGVAASVSTGVPVAVCVLSTAHEAKRMAGSMSINRRVLSPTPHGSSSRLTVSS